MDSLESKARVKTAAWSVQTRRTRDVHGFLSDQHAHVETRIRMKDVFAGCGFSSKGPLSDFTRLQHMKKERQRVRVDVHDCICSLKAEYL